MKNKKHKKRRSKSGLILCFIQLILSIILSTYIIKLGLLPMKYIVGIITVLAIFLYIPLLNQIKCVKRTVSGKIMTITISILLMTGIVYVSKAHGFVDNISGGDEKTDEMVVAVLVDDKAEKLSDAKNYKFGVQYSLKERDTKEAIKQINKELGKTIETGEFENLNTQIQALFDGKVDAVIYNKAYTSLLKDSFEEYEESVKIIYKHDIVSKILESESLEIINTPTDPFAIYLSGIDVEGDISTTGRSDVNILAVVNPVSHEILLITTPRDYYIPLPGISAGREDKLTHAGIYGVDASMDALSNLYDVDVDFYARVNFTSLPKIIDALGGVDVYSEYEFDTHPYSSIYFDTIHVDKGINHFNGAEALIFSRERKNLPNGDFDRGRNQQAVITAMLKRAVSPAILSGALEIFDSLSENVDTNMSAKQIKSLIKSQIAQPEAWNITSMSAEGTPDMKICYSVQTTELSVCIPDYESVEKIKDAIDKVLDGQKLEGSETIEDHSENK